jgi:hypothetical protein
MADLRDVMVYFCRHYPHKHELSKARLTKMVYLADWRSALRRGRPITGINWEFSYYGPYVHDVAELARQSEDFEVIRGTNVYGDAKETIQVREGALEPELEPEDRETLDFVVERTAPMNWDRFIKLVYSTYPVVTQPRFSEFDLQALATEYRESVEWLAGERDGLGDHLERSLLDTGEAVDEPPGSV